MRYKFLSILLCSILLISGCVRQRGLNSPAENTVSPIPSVQSTPEPILISPSPAQTSAAPTEPGIYINSQRIVDCLFTESNQTVYASFEPIIRAIQPSTAVTRLDSATTFTAAELSVTIYHHENYIIANDRYLFLPFGVLLQNGEALLPVETIARIFDCEIQTEGDVINFIGEQNAITPGNLYYDPDEVFWLSHLIHAESGNQPLTGKIAVGNVVLNRVSNTAFPDTIYDVIFQPGQFYDSYSGSITLDPSTESIVAAKLCLDGAVVTPNAYWFNGVGIPCWASENKTLLAVIGSHAFYG